MEYSEILRKFKKARTIKSLNILEARALDRYTGDPFISMSIAVAAEQRTKEILNSSSEEFCKFYKV